MGHGVGCRCFSTVAMRCVCSFVYWIVLAGAVLCAGAVFVNARVGCSACLVNELGCAAAHGLFSMHAFVLSTVYSLSTRTSLAFCVYLIELAMNLFHLSFIPGCACALPVLLPTRMQWPCIGCWLCINA